MSFMRNGRAAKLLPQRVIVFQEGNHERKLYAATDEDLAKSCLVVLRERFSNPAWNYKPQIKNLSDEEEDFLDFWVKEEHNLPNLLERQGKRIYERLLDRIAENSDPDWNWYNSVRELLALPVEKAALYKLPYRGQYIPTAYYLILKRKDFPNENFFLVEEHFTQSPEE